MRRIKRDVFGNRERKINFSYPPPLSLRRCGRMRLRWLRDRLSRSCKSPRLVARNKFATFCRERKRCARKYRCVFLAKNPFLACACFRRSQCIRACKTSISYREIIQFLLRFGISLKKNSRARYFAAGSASNAECQQTTPPARSDAGTSIKR